MNFQFSSACLLSAILAFAVVFEVAAQQQPAKQPLEYIESSSPVAGGGVVTSVYIPGRGAPSYQSQSNSTSRGPTYREASLRNTDNSNSQSVLSPAQITPQNPQASSFYTNPNQANVAMRPNCVGCGVGGATTPPPTVLSPQPFNNAASFPPTLGNIGRPGAVFNRVPVVGNGRSTYTPIIPLRNGVPANAYAGQGIFGSPKLYVEGQPLRNFLRYISIP